MAQKCYEEAKKVKFNFKYFFTIFQKFVDPVMNECHKISSETEIYKARGTIFNLFLNEGETV